MELVNPTGASGKIEWGAWPPKPLKLSYGLLGSVLATCFFPDRMFSDRTYLDQNFPEYHIKNEYFPTSYLTALVST